MEQKVLQESEQIERLTDDVLISEKDKLDRDMDSGTLLGLIPVLILLLVIFVRIAFVIYKSSVLESGHCVYKMDYSVVIVLPGVIIITVFTCVCARYCALVFCVREHLWTFCALNMFVAFFFWMTLLLVFVLAIGFQRARQKTRNSQQSRTYMGTRQRPSDTQAEPTIYVSPANLPPPPKYEAMAPPSYEEVVGIHYPNFQPISQPISTALAQASNTTDTNVTSVNVVDNNNAIAVNNANNSNGNNVIASNTQVPSAVLSVISERSPVTASS